VIPHYSQPDFHTLIIFLAKLMFFCCFSIAPPTVYKYRLHMDKWWSSYMFSQHRLDMRGISIQFAGVKALDQVDFVLLGGTAHALSGVNGAGKSTLMAVLAGTHPHYTGTISINGEQVQIRTPKQARQHGIHLVQQEVDVALLPGLSVAENIMLDAIASPGFVHSWRSIRTQATAALAQLGISLNVRQRIEQCSLAEKQQILLARALTHQCRFLILDEPTAPLDQHESERLFQVVARLKQNGLGIVFISHRLHEIRHICDSLTVLRDGQLVDTAPMAQFSQEAIAEKMLGHQLTDIFPPRRPHTNSNPLLEIQGLRDANLLQDISFQLHPGEILGFAGLAGAGKTELCKALFGANPCKIQHGRLHDQPWRPRNPVHAIASGLALVPEERRKEGIFVTESMTTNLSAAFDQHFSSFGLFSFQRALDWAATLVKRLNIRPAAPKLTLTHFSGGNQQKVAIGKWLQPEVQVLVLDEPTKGIDVSAKTDLFHLLDSLARDGKGIIYASGDFSELVGLCDRICILFDGKIVAEVNGAEAREELLLHYSTGGVPA